jgi:hypothetical protein
MERQTLVQKSNRNDYLACSYQKTKVYFLFCGRRCRALRRAMAAATNPVETSPTPPRPPATAPSGGSPGTCQARAPPRAFRRPDSTRRGGEEQGVRVLRLRLPQRLALGRPQSYRARAPHRALQPPDSTWRGGGDEGEGRPDELERRSSQPCEWGNGGESSNSQGSGEVGDGVWVLAVHFFSMSDSSFKRKYGVLLYIISVAEKR